MIDNIVIGTPLVPLEDLGVLPDEQTVSLTIEEMLNDKGELFLPAILKHVGLFKSTSEIKKISTQRTNNKKIVDPASRNLWRVLDGPEFTHFKIGKKVFWLIVGE